MVKLLNVNNKKQPPINKQTKPKVLLPKKTALTPHKSTAPRYIPIEDLIQASEDNPNLSEMKIAKLFDLHPSTVSSRFRHAGYTPKRLKRYKDNKANIWDFHASKILNSVTNRDIKKASMLQRYTAAGICNDKAMVERGQMPVSKEKLVFEVVQHIDNRQINITPDRHNPSDNTKSPVGKLIPENTD